MATAACLLSVYGCADLTDTGGKGDDPAGTAVSLRAAGDVMMGTDFPANYLPPDDGQFLLADVETLLDDADVTFLNLEGPLCDGGTTSKCSPGSNCYAFRTPTRYGQYIKNAGVDVVSLANNHALDFGEYCRQETIDTVDALGIAQSGRPGSIATVRAGRQDVALIAFHTAQHSNWLNDHDAAADLVAQAAEDHDIVVVSFHGGAEGTNALHVPDGREYFYGEDRGHLRRFARDMIAAGADVILGHGPHVPRGMEVVEGRLVAYSLGNFATYGRFSLSGAKGLSLILDLKLARDGRFLGGEIFPLKLVDRGFPVQDDTGASVDLISELSDADFPETGVRVEADGRIYPQ